MPKFDKPTDYKSAVQYIRSMCEVALKQPGNAKRVEYLKKLETWSKLEEKAQKNSVSKIIPTLKELSTFEGITNAYPYLKEVEQILNKESQDSNYSLVNSSKPKGYGSMQPHEESKPQMAEDTGTTCSMM